MPDRYVIVYSREAEGDLDHFDRSDQVLIDTAIEQRLSYEPMKEDRNRKPHRRTTAIPADWELRIGAFRAFYDADDDERLVGIVNIGLKRREKLYIRGQEVIDADDSREEGV